MLPIVLLAFAFGLLATAMVHRAWRLPLRILVPSALCPLLALLLFATFGLVEAGVLRYRPKSKREED